MTICCNPKEYWKIYVVSWVLSIILLLSSWQTKIKADLKGLMFCMCCRYFCTVMIICTNLQLLFLWPIYDLRSVVKSFWNYAFASVLLSLSLSLSLSLTQKNKATNYFSSEIWYSCFINFSFVCKRHHVIQSTYLSVWTYTLKTEALIWN